MAKVSYSALVNHARKHIGPITPPGETYRGGVVFSRGRYGDVVQTYVDYDHTPSASQLLTQAAMRDARAAWSDTLTEAQRVAWNAAAANILRRSPIRGATMTNGFSQFVRCNFQLLWAVLPLLTDPPEDLTVTQPSAFAITSAVAATHTLTVSFGPSIRPNEFRSLFATPQLSAGTMWPWRKLQWITDLAPADATPQNVGTFYEAVWGVMAAAKKIGLHLLHWNSDTGLTSERISASILTT